MNLDMILEKVITMLQATSPIEVLKKIISFDEDAIGNFSGAVVKISFSSGLVLEGRALKLNSDGNMVFVTVANTISYVNVNALEAIEILNPESLLEVLTDGEYFKVPEEEVPTNYQLKKILKTSAENFKSSFGFGLQSKLLENSLFTEVEKYQFKQFLSVLEEIITSIGKDDVGKQALGELNEIVIISNEESIQIEESKNKLIIGINFKSKFSKSFKNKLKEAFELKL